MPNIDKLFNYSPYELKKYEKEELLVPLINSLVQHHFEKCPEYKKILNAMGICNSVSYNKLEQVPFLPVRLFKEYSLKSIDDANIIKTLTSSGTTSQVVSKIYLDKQTARYQTKALVTLIQSFIGNKRLPMLIVDHSNVVKDRASFSARGAGIMGMMNFGFDHTYILKNESMEIDFDVLDEFIGRHKGKKILVFGFTFMVWKYFIQALKEKNKGVDIPEGILIHSGGWKKLQDEAVDNPSFKRSLEKYTKINSVHDFYGMVEQVGSIFIECEMGNLHAPIFSDVLIRDPYDWSEVSYGEEGLIQVISTLPYSYPGHVLLTEDLGVVHGEDDCACGRKGKYFSVLGRLPKAEIRGCSDTHAAEA